MMWLHDGSTQVPGMVGDLHMAACKLSNDASVRQRTPASCLWPVDAFLDWSMPESQPLDRSKHIVFEMTNLVCSNMILTFNG